MTQALEACVAASADNDVIVNLNSQFLGRLHDPVRHFYIGAGGGGVARGMIMDENDGTGRKLQSPLDNFARVNRRVIDRAFLLHLIGDEQVLLV